MGSELDSYYWKLIVAIYKGMPDHLDSPPYNPYGRYPELISILDISNAPNPAYEGVRSCLRLLGLDGVHGIKRASSGKPNKFR